MLMRGLGIISRRIENSVMLVRLIGKTNRILSMEGRKSLLTKGEDLLL
uniref:Uncharacterized protein n=1 Tax=Lotus japonicus TaxID=34305 RepID=I3T4B3_LOTJA|nr:unknown [Lotus japonicus]